MGKYVVPNSGDCPVCGQHQGLLLDNDVTPAHPIELNTPQCPGSRQPATNVINFYKTKRTRKGQEEQ